MKKVLLLLTDGPIDAQTAERVREQAEAMLGVEVAIITGMRQALLIDGADDAQ